MVLKLMLTPMRRNALAAVWCVLALASVAAQQAPTFRSGVALVTVPGISQIVRENMDREGDYWRFTTRSIERTFGRFRVETQDERARQIGRFLDGAFPRLAAFTHASKMRDKSRPGKGKVGWRGWCRFRWDRQKSSRPSSPACFPGEPAQSKQWTANGNSMAVPTEESAYAVP